MHIYQTLSSQLKPSFLSFLSKPANRAWLPSYQEHLCLGILVLLSVHAIRIQVRSELSLSGFGNYGYYPR